METIFPALFRRVNDVAYEKERINTQDDDFLDLFWIKRGGTELIIISHGLEGDAHRPYIKGMVRACAMQGYDVLAWNFRGCGEEMNKQLRFYHSGATDDLHTVVQHAEQKGYARIHLIGFSLGGNLTLKYLGEQGKQPAPVLGKAVTFSVPLDLHGSCVKISQRSNFIYAHRFLRNLKAKIQRKAVLMPGKLSLNGLTHIKTLIDFDNQYTAPLHGFENAIAYYEACSALHFLKDIHVPTLIVNAKNDPFLSDTCYPTTQLKNHPYITFETPAMGGHVGFTAFNDKNYYWSEERTLIFLSGS